MWSKKLKDVYQDNYKKRKKYILISSHTDGPSSNRRLIDNLKAIKNAYYFNNDYEFEKTK